MTADAFGPKRLFSPDTMTELYGINVQWIAETCGVHITTARRWKRGEEPPLAAATLIKLLSTGDLGLVDARWKGWRLTGGKLFSPEDVAHSPGDVQGTFFWRQLVDHYQKRQRFEQQADWIQGEYVPARDMQAAV